MMLSIVGTYENGYLKLDKKYASKKPIKVIVTFLEDIQTITEDRLVLTDFSFSKSKENLKSYSGSFTDTVIEERRTAL
jgi:hypothetical protein